METAALLQMIFRLGATAVVTIEKAHGDQLAGADKRVLAKDWLRGVATGAMSVLTGDKAALAAEAEDAAEQAVDAGFDLAKKSGAYDKATLQAKGKHQAIDAQPDQATASVPVADAPAVDAAGAASTVASVVSISEPHRGSIVAEVVQEFAKLQSMVHHTPAAS